MKNFVHSLCLVSTVLLVVSCVTVQDVPPYTYTGDKSIYPAVHYAIVNGNQSTWNNSQVSVSDPNTVLINHVRVSDGLKLADFTLRVSLVNSVVTYQFSNIRQKLPTGPDSDWTRVDKFLQPDRELIFTSYFNTEIPKIMEDETLYAKAKEAADKSFGGAPGESLGGTHGGGELTISLPLQNPQNNLLYPAVGAAFTNLKGTLGAKTADLRDIYCLDNQFTIRGCVAERKAFDIITYQIKISCLDNQLTFEFINIEEGLDAVLYSAREIESLPRFDTQRTANQLKTEIERSLANAAAYSAAKKAFFENNFFLNRAFVPVTSALRDEFTATLFKNEEISLSVYVSDVNNNDTAEFKNYATVITGRLYTNIDIAGSFASVTLYTNDSSLARIRQRENATLSGQFVRLEYGTGTPRFILTK